MERGLVDITHIWNQFLLHHNEWNSLPSTTVSCKSLI
ncbi:LOW QUALITY PROTEIN: hypothetical protein NP493_683g02000 [Ridgeia piscesae]|uniref:Uncharacterized protein n=1 Tax=Ridgeia piscesae TaxID=27915 RepID=A0AAD9KSJ6_RIDPI|nr:LOW QUALITY PROTEIN: hypothetical protein NP493_683g02000 [Ridgeia piscesae]